MTSQEQEQVPSPREPKAASHHSEFVSRVAIVFGIGTIFLLGLATVWLAGNVLLLIFASILVAVLLSGATKKLMQWLPLSRGVALMLVLLLTIIVFGLAGYLLAPRIAEQIDPLISTLPSSVQDMRMYLQQYGWMRDILETLPPAEQIMSDLSGMVAQARLVFSGLLGAIANFVIVLFVAIYLASRPHTYIDGFLKLVSKRNRPRGREVFQELGATLELWLLGKMLSMIIVGTTTAIGLTLLDVPLAITLGVLAGLFDFIPYLGPILAGVPAVLIAFSESPSTALYVLFLFIAIQMAEGYLLLPLVERQTVSLPPALTITMQVLLALPFGLLGIALATPLTAVLCVVIVMLYVQDVLHDPVRTPSEQHEK